MGQSSSFHIVQTHWKNLLEPNHQYLCAISWKIHYIIYPGLISSLNKLSYAITSNRNVSIFCADCVDFEYAMEPTCAGDATGDKHAVSEATQEASLKRNLSVAGVEGRDKYNK